jgi:hypothetical protein
MVLQSHWKYRICHIWRYVLDPSGFLSPRNRFSDNNSKGSWCGLSAAFLWVAEGTAITLFASEDKKGLYVSIFWSVFQCGVVIGAAIPVGQNWNAGTANGSRVNDGTYVGLFILMLCGAFLGLTLYPWQKIVREDGSRVTLKKTKSFVEELVSSWVVFKTHPWILFFWPWC